MDAQVRTPPPSIDQARLLRMADPQALIALFRRRLHLLAAVAVLVFAAVAAATFLTAPKYTATAQVMLDPRKEKVTGIQDVLSGLPADTAVVDTEAEVLKSRALAERVVSAEKLDQDPEFNSSLRKGGLFGGKGGAPLSSIEQQKRHDRVVDAVLKRLKIKRTGQTYMIEVGFESDSPEKAARIAGAFADRYLLEQLEAKFEATRNANQWLNGRLGELRTQVQDAEAAVEQFKAANGLISAQGATLTEQEISGLNQQLALARVQQAESEARLRTARQQLAAGSNGEDVGEALGSQVVQDLRRQRTEVSRKIAELQSRYGPRHPEVLKTQGELTDIDNQIQAEIRRIVSNLEAQAQIQRERTGSLLGSLSQSRGTLAVNNRATVRLRELERNAESVRTLYESFLTRFKETSAQEGIEQSDARVVSRPKIPTAPSTPNVKLNLALGLLLALGAGVAAVILRELLDTGLGTAEDVEQVLGLPHLAGVPTLASTLDRKAGEVPAPADFVVDKPLSSFSESFRNLRTSLQFSRLGETVKVVAITSSLPDEGKTTTSICLARSMAMAGDRVVVVDCDLRKRALNRVLGVEPEAGLLEVLAGTATLEQALRKDEVSGADILPLARSAYTPKDVFGTAAMDKLLADLRKRYDMVILDTAPVLPVADTRALATKADVVALLVRWRKTPRKAAETALKLLQTGETHVAGAVLSQIDLRQQARYGYGDPGYYYSSYRKYYAA
jgi:exopolysaccharide transport family protein